MIEQIKGAVTPVDYLYSTKEPETTEFVGKFQDGKQLKSAEHDIFGIVAKSATTGRNHRFASMEALKVGNIKSVKSGKNFTFEYGIRKTKEIKG